MLHNSASKENATHKWSLDHCLPGLHKHSSDKVPLTWTKFSSFFRQILNTSIFFFFSWLCSVLWIISIFEGIFPKLPMSGWEFGNSIKQMSILYSWFNQSILFWLIINYIKSHCVQLWVSSVMMLAETWAKISQYLVMSSCITCFVLVLVSGLKII